MPNDKQYRTFVIGEQTLDVPIENADKFLVKYPNAKEYKSFIIDKDTMDVPIENADKFLAKYPNAKETYPADLKKKDTPQPIGEPIQAVGGTPSQNIVPDGSLTYDVGKLIEKDYDQNLQKVSEQLKRSNPLIPKEPKPTTTGIGETIIPAQGFKLPVSEPPKTHDEGVGVTTTADVIQPKDREVKWGKDNYGKPIKIEPISVKNTLPKSIDQLEGELQNDPYNPDLLEQTWKQYQKLGLPVKEKEVLDVILSVNPKRQDLLNERAYLNYKLGNMEQAYKDADDFTKAYERLGDVGEIDNTNISVIDNKAYAYNLKNNVLPNDSDAKNALRYTKWGNTMRENKELDNRIQTMKNFDKYWLTSPLNPLFLWTSGSIEAGQGIDKILETKEIAQSRGDFAGAVNLLSGLMEFGMAAGSFVLPSNSFGKLSGSLKALKTSKAIVKSTQALGFIFPSLIEFKTGMQMYGLVGAEEYVQPLLAPVTTILKEAGVDTSKYTKTGQEVVGFLDLAAFMVIMHTAQLKGAKGTDMKKFGEETFPTYENLSKKIINREPLTFTENKLLNETIAKLTPEDVVVADYLTTDKIEKVDELKKAGLVTKENEIITEPIIEAAKQPKIEEVTATEPIIEEVKPEAPPTELPKEIKGMKVVEEVQSAPDGEKIFKVLDENGNERFLTIDGKEAIVEKISTIEPLKAQPEASQIKEENATEPKSKKQIETELQDATKLDEGDTYDNIQTKIEEIEGSLEKKGKDPYKMFDERLNKKSDFPEGYEKMPQELADLYQKMFKIENRDRAIVKKSILDGTKISEQDANTVLNKLGLGDSNYTSSYAESVDKWSVNPHEKIEKIYNSLNKGEDYVGFSLDMDGKGNVIIKWDNELNPKTTKETEELYNAIATIFGKPRIKLSKEAGYLQISEPPKAQPEVVPEPIIKEGEQAKVADKLAVVSEEVVPEVQGSYGSDVYKITNAKREAKKTELRNLIKEQNDFLDKYGENLDTKYLIDKHKELSKKIIDLRYELRKPITIEKIPAPQDRKSVIPSDIVKVAWDDLVNDKKVFDEISDAAMGVEYDADTSIDKIMNGENKEITPSRLYSTFDKTRKALSDLYGEKITLYRAEGMQKSKSTKNWISTEEGAKQYGENIIKKEIVIDDIVAVNTGLSGKYEEFIVSEKPIIKEEITTTPTEVKPIEVKEGEKQEEKKAMSFDEGITHIQKIYGSSASDYVKKQMVKDGLDEIGNVNRVIKTAENIDKLSNKTNSKEALFEALSYEYSYPNNFNDIRKFVNKGGIENNREQIQRMIDVGVEVPKDITDQLTQGNIAPTHKSQSDEIKTKAEGRKEGLLTPQGKTPPANEVGGGKPESEGQKKASKVADKFAQQEKRKREEVRADDYKRVTKLLNDIENAVLTDKEKQALSDMEKSGDYNAVDLINQKEQMFTNHATEKEIAEKLKALGVTIKEEGGIIKSITIPLSKSGTGTVLFEALPYMKGEILKGLPKSEPKGFEPRAEIKPKTAQTVEDLTFNLNQAKKSGNKKLVELWTKELENLTKTQQGLEQVMKEGDGDFLLDQYITQHKLSDKTIEEVVSHIETFNFKQEGIKEKLLNHIEYGKKTMESELQKVLAESDNKGNEPTEGVGQKPLTEVKGEQDTAGKELDGEAYSESITGERKAIEAEPNPEGAKKLVEEIDVVLQSKSLSDQISEAKTIPELQEIYNKVAENDVLRLQWQKKQAEINKNKKTKDTLDFLDGLKIDTEGKAYDATMGIPIQLWNSAIDIIKVGVKAGKLLSDVVTEAIDYIKKTAPNFDENRFRNFFEESMTKSEKQLRDELKTGLQQRYKDIEKTFFKEETKQFEEYKPKINVVNKILGLPNTIQEKLFGSNYDKLGNGLANLMAKGMSSKNKLARLSTKFINSVFAHNVARTTNEVARSEAFMGASTDRSISDANKINDVLREQIGNDKESFRRIDKVLDPDFYRERTLEEFSQIMIDDYGIKQYNKLSNDQIAEMYNKYREEMGINEGKQITYEDLSPMEKNVHDKIRLLYDFIHDTSFVIGKIDKDVYLKNKNRYSARLYDMFETPPDMNEIMNSAPTKMQMGGYKERGNISEWKIEHKIEDPIYTVTKRLYQTLLNKGIYDYSNWINTSRPEWVSKNEKKGYTKLGNGYGELSNKHVRDDIAEDFKGIFFANKHLNDLYDLLKRYNRWTPRQFYKKLFTVYNPGVQVGNHTGNIIFSSWLGISPVRFEVNFWKNAVKEVQDYSPTYRMLMDKGLLKSDLTREDLISTIDQLTNALDEASKSNNPLKWVGDNMQNIYQKNDDLAKIAGFLSLTQMGMKPETAIKRVADGYQNFRRVAKSYDIVSKLPVIGNPFGRFPGDLSRIVRTGLATRPLTYAAFGGTLAALASMTSALSGESEDDKKIRESRIGFPKIPLSGLTFGHLPDIPLAFKLGKNELNIARFISPYYIYSTPDNDDTYQALTRMSPFQWDFTNRTINPSGITAVNIAKNLKDPVFAGIGQLILDSDWKGLPVIDPNATFYKKSSLTPKEKIINSFRFLARAYIPYGSYGDDLIRAMGGKEDYYGRTKTPSQILLRFIGYNSQQFPDDKYTKILESSIKADAYQFKDNASILKQIEKDREAKKITDTEYLKRYSYYMEKQAKIISNTKETINKSKNRLRKKSVIEILNNVGINKSDRKTIMAK